MQMGSRGSSTITRHPHHITSQQLVALTHGHLRKMAVADGIVTMTDGDKNA